MWIDPIIEELHRIREEHAKKFNYNLRAMFDDLKQQEKRSGKTYVSLPIRRKAPNQDKAVVKEKELTAV